MATKPQKPSTTPIAQSRTRDWTSRWYASNKDFAGMLAEDIKVREYLKARLKNASVSRVLIERPAKNARITIFSARPGVVIGKKGEDIESLKRELAKQLGVPVAVNIEEVRKPEIDAKLIADSITQQLEKRVMFRRAMKRAMQNAMRLGAQGIKIMSSGRLNGTEIARTEWYREGRVPLHTLRADIDYGVSEAKTTYGIIGVKVWVYKGDTLGYGDSPVLTSEASENDRRPRSNVRPGSAASTGKKNSGTGFSLLGAARSVEGGTATSVAKPEPFNPHIEVGRVISALNARESKTIIESMPRWVPQQMVTEVTRLELTLGACATPADLLRAIVTTKPKPIPALPSSSQIRLAAGKEYSVIGRFASGAVRTIGSLEVGPDGSAALEPFSYWHLIDPADKILDPNKTMQIESTVDLIAIEIV